MAQHKHPKDTVADRLIGCVAALVVTASAIIAGIIVGSLLIYAWVLYG